jgi:hypothetical protein
MSGVNEAAILGFKYSLSSSNVTLSPPKGTRKIVFLQRVGPSLQWFHILEPHHDSNKLYSCFKGLPTDTMVQLQLEDLGLDEVAGFKATAEPLPQETTNSISLMDFIGAGWMTDDDNVDATQNSTPILLAYGKRDIQSWQVMKLKEGGEVSSLLADMTNNKEQFDIVIPFVQPKRVVSEKGVYFVG